jgi:hypothetical protein
MLYLGLKYRGKIPQYLNLPPWAIVTKLFSMAIFFHWMVITGENIV